MTPGRLLVRTRASVPLSLDQPDRTGNLLTFIIGGRRVANMAGFVIRLPGLALLALIGIYQRTLSPALPVFFGSACGCRFAPSCSHYAADAIRTHGAVVGVILAAIRLLKCTPLHPGGFDPVPPPRHSRPRCTSVADRPD
jgi:uncharacterized protein